MRKLALTLIIVLIVGSVWFYQQMLNFGAVQGGNFFADENELKRHVGVLTEVQPARNWENIQSLDSIAAYIHKHFSQFSPKVEYQEYEHQGKKYKNVIAIFKGNSEERVVVGAHYDVCGNQQGADDNASGVAGLLEIARLLQMQKHLPYTVELVAFTLEEPPFFRTQLMGSYIHAENLVKKNIPVKMMLCLEMIGFYTDKADSQEFPSAAMKAFYPSTGNFIAVVGNMKNPQLTNTVKKLINKSSVVPAYALNAPASMEGVDFSDHANYWSFGISAVMITDTAFYRNKNYHQNSDTPATLNYSKMAYVVNGLMNVLVNYPVK